MSRGIRDLREIICVSRLCNAYQQHEVVDIVDQMSALEQSISIGKSPHKSSHSRTALPDIKTYSNIDNNSDKLFNNIELIDEKLLSEWLHRANRQLHQLIGWAQDENAFVNFTNFWLLEMASSDRRELLVMEYGILVEEIKEGLMRYITGNVDQLSYQLISISFWEYQQHFHPSSSSSSGSYYLFLEYLDGLLSTAGASGNSEVHKYIFTNVKFPTQNKHLIQILLTIRALALVSIWTAVIDFYRKLIDRGAIQLRSVELIHQLPNHLPADVIMYRRICVAICHQFIPTLQYWINKKKINFQEYRDEQGRNLLILAVSYNSLSVVQYFVNNYNVSNIINSASKTGNSALHLAVCQGNIDIVKLLIDVGHSDVNIANKDCDNCTPLHMAAMYGLQDIAQYLIEHGANLDSVTGSNSATAIDMANLYKQYEVVKLLQDARCPPQSKLGSISDKANVVAGYK